MTPPSMPTETDTWTEGTGWSDQNNSDDEQCHAEVSGLRPDEWVKSAPARPMCCCACGCRRKPGRRIPCPGFEHLVGPGGCWSDEHGRCHMCTLNALDDDDVMHNEKKDQSNEEVVLPPPDEQGTGDNQGATASSSPPQAKKSRRRRRTPGKNANPKNPCLQCGRHLPMA